MLMVYPKKYEIISEATPHIPAIAPIAIIAPKQISALLISLFSVSWVMVPILSVVVSIVFAMTDLLSVLVLLFPISFIFLLLFCFLFSCRLTFMMQE